jgi:hypothetical protein
MLAAPLIAGNDLRNMRPEIHDILTNKEVIAVDQDALGREGERVWKSGDLRSLGEAVEGWQPGCCSVKSRHGTEQEYLSELGGYLGYPSHLSASVRDLWQHKDLGKFTGKVFRSRGVSRRSRGDGETLSAVASYCRGFFSGSSLSSWESSDRPSLPRSGRCAARCGPKSEAATDNRPRFRDGMVEKVVAQVVVGGADVIHRRLAALLERLGQIRFRRPSAGGAEELRSLRFVAAVGNSLRIISSFPFTCSRLSGAAGDPMICFSTKPKALTPTPRCARRLRPRTSGLARV